MIQSAEDRGKLGRVARMSDGTLKKSYQQEAADEQCGGSDEGPLEVPGDEGLSPGQPLTSAWLLGWRKRHWCWINAGVRAPWLGVNPAKIAPQTRLAGGNRHLDSAKILGGIGKGRAEARVGLKSSGRANQ